VLDKRVTWQKAHPGGERCGWSILETRGRHLIWLCVCRGEKIDLEYVVDEVN